MPSITSVSHFVDDLQLPHPEAVLTQSITIHEPYVLENVLGYEMYKTLYANLSNVSGIWYDLINGKEFTNEDGELMKWHGFKKVGYNPLACYVYCNELRKNLTITTGIGEMSSSNENMRATSPIQKHKNAWNKMTDLFCVMDEFLCAEIDNYPLYNGMNTFNGYKRAVQFFTKINEFDI